MKAYQVTHPSFGDMKIITAAPMAGAAKYANYRNAARAEYRVRFVDFRAQRTAQFDELAASAESGATLGWDDGCVRHGCMAIYGNANSN